MKYLALAITALFAVEEISAQIPVSGRRAESLVIRNAIIVDGAGTPAIGPADIVVRGNRIAEIVWLDPVSVANGKAKRPTAATEIDAKGKYVLPGLINGHGHVQVERGGIPQPLDYELKLWLASGITSVREVGADDTQSLIDLRGKSERGEIASPRIFVYARFSNPPAPETADQARQRIRDLKKIGVDGIKVSGRRLRQRSTQKESTFFPVSSTVTGTFKSSEAVFRSPWTMSSSSGLRAESRACVKLAQTTRRA